MDEGSFQHHNDCTPRFSRARSWQSHFLCNFMVVFLNEDIGCSEARGQSLPAPFSGLFRSMFPFTWWKVIHHLHPWILPLFPFFSFSLPFPPLPPHRAIVSLSSNNFLHLPSSPLLPVQTPQRYLWRCWEIDRFNTTTPAGQPSLGTG